MYNDEYPDLILEGLMCDLSIIEESTSDKNIFQKFVAFLKRIGQWFVKMFKKIIDKFKKVESKKEENKSELTDEELSKIEVANYETSMIGKFIKISETAFKKNR